MPKSETIDADFFALVHHVLDAQRRDPNAERRDNRRQRYSAVQYVASIDAGKLPVAADFQQILCYDLSPTGFSFLAAAPPNYQHLVVALGVSTYIYVTAAIAHQQLLEVEGQQKYLVGCRFISRLNMSGGGPLAELKSTRARHPLRRQGW